MVNKVSPSTGDGTKGDFGRVDDAKGTVALDSGDKTKGGQPASPQGRAADTLMDGSMLMMAGNSGMPGTSGMPGSLPTPNYSLNGPEDPEEEEDED